MMEMKKERSKEWMHMHRVQSETMISKKKAKIRIIHIVAPDIIKTDVANFRHLVQTLTGKTSSHHQNYASINNTPPSTAHHPHDILRVVNKEQVGGPCDAPNSSSGGYLEEEAFISDDHFADFPLLPFHHTHPNIIHAFQL